MLSLYTKNNYHRETSTENINPAVQTNLISLYTINNSKGFNDSITIIKSPNTYTDLETFVKKNTEDINRPNYDEDSKKETSLKNCETDIAMIVQQSKFTDEDHPIYFVQSFFLTQKDAYIISAATDNEDEYDQLYSDFKGITCREI